MEIDHIEERELTELPALPEIEVEYISPIVAIDRGYITDREVSAWLKRRTLYVQGESK